MSPEPYTPSFRFPLFGKMIAGFILIILFMVISSISVLFQLQESFSSAKTELKETDVNARRSQQLAALFEDEARAARRFLSSGAQVDYDSFLLHKESFKEQIGALKLPDDRHDLRLVFDLGMNYHMTYESFLSEYKTALGDAKHTAASRSSLREQLHANEDSLRVTLGSLFAGYHFSVTKAISLFERRTSDAIDGAIVIFLLSLIMGLAVSVLLTRTITQPIQSLKAGTTRIADGNYDAIPITTSDEIAELTAAFNRMSGKLKRLDEMRMELMSEISHEMRSPLQVVKAGCYTIMHAKESAPLTDRQKDAVGMIHQAANRINSFVNSFLDVAKLEAGLMTFDFQPADLTEMLQSLIQEARLIGQTRQVCVDFETEEIPQLTLDSQRMSQVFSNLLSNALKYTPDGGTITVKLVNLETHQGHNGKNGGVRVDIRDTGVGIPEDDLAKLFSKFYQAKNTPVVRVKGSGLGLALVKQVTEAHGGHVSVSSQVGVGSVFSVFLPRTVPSTAEVMK